MMCLNFVLVVNTVIVMSVSSEYEIIFVIGQITNALKGDNLKRFHSCLCNSNFGECGVNLKTLQNSNETKSTNLSYIKNYFCYSTALDIKCTRLTTLNDSIMLENKVSFSQINETGCDLPCVETLWNSTTPINITIKMYDRASYNSCSSSDQPAMATNSDLTQTIIIIIVVVIVVVILIVSVMVYACRRRRRAQSKIPVLYTVPEDSPRPSNVDHHQDQLYSASNVNRLALTSTAEQAYSDPAIYAKLHENPMNLQNPYSTFDSLKNISSHT